MTKRADHSKTQYKDHKVIEAVLHEVCKADENGFAVYAKGWTDHKVSVEATARLNGRVNVSMATVRNIRSQVIGLFPVPGKNVPTKAAKTAPSDPRIAELEAKLAEQAELLTRQTTLINDNATSTLASIAALEEQIGSIGKKLIDHEVRLADLEKRQAQLLRRSPAPVGGVRQHLTAR